MRAICAAIIVLLVWASPSFATAEHRIALVIGNTAYTGGALKNAVNDSRAMAAALRESGFDVIARENTTKAELEHAIAAFGAKLSADTIGLVYYAGHGLQVGGRNYLVPVDADITMERQVPLMAVDADVVQVQMAEARTRLNIIILDACRNNPFARGWRSLDGGLAQLNAPKGTLIAYATAPGKVASDGTGPHGLYTQELLKTIRQPGLKVEDVFKKVRIAVAAATHDVQVPWEASSLMGDFYFLAPSHVPMQSAAPYPRLGVEISTLTPARAEGLGLSARAGVLVKTVFADSPAAHAGLLPHDVVVAVDGRTVTDAALLRDYVMGASGSVRLSLHRNGRAVTADVAVIAGES